MGEMSFKELQDKIDEAAGQVVVGGTYVHYKGTDKLYKVTGFAVREFDNEVVVLYRPLYIDEDITFSRPVGEWVDRVEWQGKTVPRFKIKT